MRATQRQIPDLARITREVTHLVELLTIRFYLEFVGVQTFRRVILRFRILNRPKDANGVRALVPRPELRRLRNLIAWTRFYGAPDKLTRYRM